jgi:type IV secretion system protein TrbL
MAGRMLIQVMLICAAFLLINQLPIWIGGLVFDSFAQIGENVAGDFMSPTLVVSYGSEFSAILMGGLSQVGLLDAMAIVFWVALVSILVYISFLLIAAQLVITYMEVYTVLGLGGFVMAFGANQWTARLSENYLAYALHVGIKMLLLTLIVALGGPLIFDWGQRIQDGANWSTDIKPILDVVGGVFCFAFAAIYIPNRVASRLTAGMDFGWTAAMRG